MQNRKGGAQTCLRWPPYSQLSTDNELLPSRLRQIERGVNRLQRRNHLIRPAVNVQPQRPPLVRLQGFEVAQGLRVLQRAEAVCRTGNVEIERVIIGELEEHAVVRPAFVQLAGAV